MKRLTSQAVVYRALTGLSVMTGWLGVGCQPADAELEAPQQHVARVDVGVVRVQATGLRSGDAQVIFDASLAEGSGVQLDVVRDALNVWTPSTVEGCRHYEPQMPVGRGGQLWLRDAGTLHAQLSGNSAEDPVVTPRWLPSLPPSAQVMIDGVFYAHAAPVTASGIRADREVVVRSEGGADIAAFAVRANWPTSAAWVSVDNEWVGARELVERPAHDTLRVAFQGLASQAWVQVRPANARSGAWVECHFPDTNWVTFDVVALEEALGEHRAWEFTLRAVSQAAFSTEGLESGTLQLELVDRMVVERIVEDQAP